jgi:glycosyltransferase involved in cell wall biosynthesis
MAGGTADGMEPLLEHMGEGSLAGRVRHLGYVADDARERLYREASMLVLPSFDEGFGLPLLEAMTVGLPAIVARRGALPEVAREAAVFVEPEDEGAIMSAMERLLKERPHAMALAVAGIERARAFSWAGTAGRLRAAYAMAIARRREKSPR